MYVILILICLGCSSGWNTEEGRAYKEAFMETCTISASQYECQCVLDKLTLKYSGPFDNVKGHWEDAYTLVWSVLIKQVNTKIKKVILILSIFSLLLSAKIYVVDYPGQADFKAYKVDYQGQADLLVYVTDYPGQANKSDERWHYVKYSGQADSKIYWVKYPGQADIKIKFVKYPGQAGWNKSHQLIGRIDID